MDINPLFELFQQYVEKARPHEPFARFRINLESDGKGYVTMVSNAELISLFAWNSYEEGLRQFTSQIAGIRE